MNTLIISDIHHRCELAEKIISSVVPDLTIFSGDYFDDFNDTPNDIRETCNWLNYSVNKSNRIHLMGNHDISYFVKNGWYRCSGYEQWKDFIITDNVPRSTWDKMRYYYVLDNTWLVTHAGLHNKFLPNNVSMYIYNKDVFFKKLSDYLDFEIIKGLRNNSWIFRPGKKRGGFQPVGGITWCDINEFFPVIGLNQIFGHTVINKPKWIVSEIMDDDDIDVKYLEDLNVDYYSLIDNRNVSYNIDFDTSNHHYLTWNGHQLKVHWIGDL